MSCNDKINEISAIIKSSAMKFRGVTLKLEGGSDNMVKLVSETQTVTPGYFRNEFDKNAMYEVIAMTAVDICQDVFSHEMCTVHRAPD